MLWFLFYALGGVCVGISTLWLGFGGGIFIVPLLVWSLPYGGLTLEQSSHVAVGTSLAVMVLNSAQAAYKQHKKKVIPWPAVWRLAGFVCLGAVSSALMADVLSRSALKWLFIFYLALTIIRSLVKKDFIYHNKQALLVLSWWSAGVLGFLIGSISTLLGVGGAVTTVPLMRYYRATMGQAVATANVLTVPIAIAGSCVLALETWRKGVFFVLPSCLGVIYVPAFLGLLLGSFVGLPLGIRISKKAGDTVTAKVYVGLLCVVFVAMLLR